MRRSVIFVDLALLPFLDMNLEDGERVSMCRVQIYISPPQHVLLAAIRTVAVRDNRGRGRRRRMEKVVEKRAAS